MIRKYPRRTIARWALVVSCLTAASCLLSLVFGVERGFEHEFESVVTQATDGSFQVVLGTTERSDASPVQSLFPIEELEMLRENVPSAEDIAASSFPTSSMLDHDNHLEWASVSFVTSNYLSVRGLKIANGRSFTTLEYENRLAVAVAGADLISSGRATVGEVFHSPETGNDYLVIGALATQTTYPQENMRLFVPLSLYDPDLILESRSSIWPWASHGGSADLGKGVTFWVLPEPGMTEKAMEEVQTALASYNDGRRKVVTWVQDPAQTVYYKVKEFTAGSLMAAGLALLGVAVTDSTNLLLLDIVAMRRKIGIKRCVGATKLDIALEVLCRTTCLTALGTALGLVLAFATRSPFEKWFGETVLLSLGSMWRAVAVIVPCMALSGLYPAFVSSGLPPVQAVRGDPVWRPRRKVTRVDVRNVLAIVAVTIGVAGIVIMNGSSYLTQEKVEAYLRAVGERLVLIKNRDTDPGSPFVAPSADLSKPPLCLDPLLSDALPGATAASRAAWYQEIPTTVALPDSDQIYSTYVVPCSPGFSSLRRFQLSSGRFHNYGDDGAPVCVLGADMARSLFGDENPLGKTIYVASPQPFTVIGVLESRPKGVLDLTFDRNETVFIPPMSTLLVSELANRYCSGSSIILEARENEDPQALVERTAEHLASRFPNHSLPEVDKYLRSVTRMDELRRKSDKVFALTGVLAVVLSAVGVFTIMMARATEMAREIGIRRALGASKASIMRLYLGKSLGICLIGSALGFVASWPVLRLLEPLVPITISTLSALAVWAVAAGTASAVAGGLYPARAAARTTPAEVLRT